MASEFTPSFHIQTVDIILPFLLLRLCFTIEDAEVERLRTSAAFAAACPGLDESSGA